MHIEATSRLPVVLKVTSEGLFLGSDCVVLQYVVTRPIQVTPWIEESVHVLVHGCHVIGLGPVTLDAEQQVKCPDEKRQNQKPCQPISKVVAFLCIHEPHFSGQGPETCFCSHYLLS